jgi:hypothetical protein
MVRRLTQDVLGMLRMLRMLRLCSGLLTLGSDMLTLSSG